MKRHAVLVALAANYSDSEKHSFLKVTKSVGFKFRNELKASNFDLSLERNVLNVQTTWFNRSRTSSTMIPYISM